MRTWLRSWWFELQTSLWFLPAVITVAAAALAFVTVEIDLRLLLDRRAGTAWYFGGGAEGARGVLSAIAGTMVTVTALVFSITVVALQLAASQLTPRVLRSFMSDRGNQIVLGFFIGTFTFALLVLRAVRAPLEEEGGFVPAVSVSVSIVLAMVSVGLLIFFVHHAANSMRVSVVVDRVARSTLDLTDDLYPTGVADRSASAAPPPVLDQWSAGTVRTERAGYLQAVDADALLHLAASGPLTIQVLPRVGDFILPATGIALVPSAGNAGFDESVRGAFTLGLERTAQEDIEFGVLQLADIAAKALSPGINDPTTAMICVDRLAEVLLRLAERIPPDGVRVLVDGDARVVLPGPTFAGLVGVAFDRIRHYAAGDARSIGHLVATIGRMFPLVPPGCRAPLLRAARSSVEEARSRIAVEADIAAVERAAAWSFSENATPVDADTGVRVS